MSTSAVSSTKEAVIDMIRRMPDDATVSDIMEELYFRQKVDAGLRQLDAGQGIPHDDAKKRLAQWLS
jgi:predicted transcriptional regulator